MKKSFSIFLALLVSLFAFSQNNFDPESLLKQRPAVQALVYDFTNTLTSEQKQRLEDKLVVFDDSTSTQIAVVIIPSLNGNEIADYNVRLLRAWGVGNKKTNNGAVLLIAKDDHRLNITTGYGLEGALPDITCKQIIDNIIVPQFKGNDYYHGIDQGVNAIMQAVKGEFKAPENYRSGKGNVSGRFIFLIIIIIIFLAASAGGRGGGGSFMSRRGFAAWTIGNMLGGGGSGGGGWSGGGGGGGGFGGFGGGSSGGGGASGSW